MLVGLARSVAQEYSYLPVELLGLTPKNTGGGAHNGGECALFDLQHPLVVHSLLLVLVLEESSIEGEATVG